MNGYRDPQEMFQLAITHGYLSSKPGNPEYAGNYMYMGDDDNGNALFKNINNRTYLPAMELKACND